jgi:predicted TIM-barrel fold metal-dependent hydrolase
MSKPPVINCHTHIFTAEHVPPLLAKTYVPWPFYYLIHLRPIVAFFRWWNNGPATARYSVWNKRRQKVKTAFFALLDRIYPLTIPLGYYVFFFVFFLLYQLLLPIFPPEESFLSRWVNKAYQFTDRFFPDIPGIWLKVLIIAVTLLYFATIRNFILFFAKMLWKGLKQIPGPQTTDVLKRYLNIGRYAFHKRQKTILSKLKDQYPKGTHFIVLPMDMEYMNAGPIPTRYRDQMKELVNIKNMPTNKGLIHPFVFADPRRMVAVKEEKNYREGDKPYFTWSLKEGKVILGDCFIREFIEEHRFSGIKIYPALGYYAFDEKLLPLWKYCAENNIPVLTHCIRGTIFYRGVKKQDWNEHPVFMQAMEKIGTDNNDDHDGLKNDEDLEREQEKETRYINLVLPQSKNVDFSYNFTHPLNYLCILAEPLLRKVIANAKKKLPKLKTEEEKKHTNDLIELFGYTSDEAPLQRDLKNLKICFGHFGGEDEWKRYFEKDRYNYSSQLTKNPKSGINFLTTVDGEPSPGKLEQLWKYTDWYSIICSMMLQYPNVYADISYILHGDADILPLLKSTLHNQGLKEKVLYGTDFFVVRNHKSDKNMYADMSAGLDEDQFDQIARMNPVKYLSSSVTVFPETWGI